MKQDEDRRVLILFVFHLGKNDELIPVFYFKVSENGMIDRIVK